MQDRKEYRYLDELTERYPGLRLSGRSLRRPMRRCRSATLREESFWLRETEEAAQTLSISWGS